MSEEQLLDIRHTEQEVFTRWDVTGHQVNRHMYRHPHADMVVIPVSGSLDDIGYETYPGQGEATPSLGRRQGSSSCA
ncbi:MAG: hypothetical protein QOC69_1783 [Mycobacterium sp.]|nr:hypothetical protein [Mycobacterium sp.]